MVVLFVGQKNRTTELTCNESFDDFVSQELIRWTRDHYHVTSEAAETAIAGESAGGLAAAFSALRHPGIFGTVISLFGYFDWQPGEHNPGGDAENNLGEWEWIIHRYAVTPKLPLRFVMFAGKFDYGGEHSPRPAMLASNRHMRDVLLAKGYSVQYEEIAAGDALFSALSALPDALQIAMARPGASALNR
jgi:enterochelin esterase family protein